MSPPHCKKIRCGEASLRICTFTSESFLARRFFAIREIIERNHCWITRTYFIKEYIFPSFQLRRFLVLTLMIYKRKFEGGLVPYFKQVFLKTKKGVLVYPLFPCRSDTYVIEKGNSQSGLGGLKIDRGNTF